MRWGVLAATSAAVILMSVPATAQAPAPRLADPEATIVEELVVQAVERGPAWWRVKDGDTTVYILGVGADDLPSDIAWDRTWVERRLKGANVLLLGNRVVLQGGLTDIPALLKVRGQLKSKTPLEAGLPPPLRARFVAARERLGQPASRYAGWSPMWAGLMLVQDNQSKGGNASVTDAIVKIAKRDKVKRSTPATYRAVPMMQAAMGKLTPQVHEECLSDAISDISAPAGQVRARAEGWARGDVASALKGPRSFEKCLLLLGGGEEMWNRVMNDNAGAIADALKTPGHAVAVMSLRQLLAKGGVIERLEARGLEVEGPGRES